MSNKAILSLNAGSSSLKYALFDAVTLDLIFEENVEGQDVEGTLSGIRTRFPKFDLLAASHRVVHGGLKYSAPVLLDSLVIDELKKLIHLAPLHMTAEIAAIEAMCEIDSSLPQVACFDTAFHADRPRLDKMFAIPRHYTNDGVIRYGFHGLSFQYIASKLPEVVGDRARGRVLVGHLGNGASMCAMRDCKSISTSMGFTALDGLMMGTRCGAVDPGVIIYLLDHIGLSSREVDTLLTHQSGLLGVSGISNDLRDLEQSDAPSAAEAIELFCYRAACEMGKYVMLLGGLDLVVFTGGIGENSSIIRGKVGQYLKWMGVTLDEEANLRNDMCISTQDSSIGVYVLPTNEQLVLAQNACDLLKDAWSE